MNELYTANIALSVFAMAIMLFSLRGDISQSKIRNLLCGGLYATIAICALCEWAGVQMDGTPPALIPLHIAVKTIELSLAPLIGLFAGCVIHPCPRKVVHRLLCLAGFHALLVLLSAFTGLIFYVDGQNFYHHGLLYVLYMLAYGGSMVFFLVQIWFACRAYQYTGGTQLMLATLFVLFVLLGLMVQLFLPMVKIDWITISCGALMMSKFSSDMVLQTDGLTQLVNRLGYEHYLARLRVPATILMFDVDRFKDVNDCHGHLMGDACLRTIAGCIRRAYGNYGTCFRIGGDEFCVILTRRNAQYNTMTEIFQHLMDAARAENPALPTVSVGCSHFNPSTDELAESLARADARMYQNKEAHR